MAQNTDLQKSYHGVAARLDRLPIGKVQKKTLFILGGVIFCDSIDMSIGGPVIAQLLSTGWSDSNLNALFVSITMVGYLFGGLLSGAISDGIGRKKAALALCALFSLGCLAGAAAPDMYFLIGCRFIMGLGLGGAYPCCYSTLSEFTPPKKRGQWQAYIALVANSGTPVGAFLCMVILPMVGWRAIFLFCGILGLVFFALTLKFVDESPRWLCVKGRNEEAHAQLCKYEAQAAEAGKPVEPVSDETIAAAAGAQQVKELGWGFLFSRKMLGRTLSMFFAMFAMNVCVYTVVTWTPSIFVSRGFDVGYSTAMTCVMQAGIPCGVFLMSCLVEHFDRKKWFCVMLTIVGFAGLLWSQIPADQTIPIMIVGFILCMLTYGWSTHASAVYLPEVFPTQCRIRGTGASNAFGRLGGILSPFWIAFFIGQGNVTAVYLVSAGIALFAVIFMAIFGFETRGKTLEEINKGVID